MATNIALPDGFVLDSDNSVNSVPSLPDGFVLDSQQQAPQQSERGFFGDVAAGLAETGKSLAQAGVNAVNIIPAVGDAVVSAGAWAGDKVGLGDGTYTPASRFELPDNMKPTTTEGKIFSEALPYLINPAAKAAPAAGNLATKAANFVGRVAAENTVGSLAANSAENNPEKLATDLAVGTAMGGAVHGLMNAAGAGYRAIKGTISPESKELIDFAKQNNVPLHTTDVLPPQSKTGKLAQSAAENVPVVGTSGMRATQQKARSDLIQNFANKFGDYNPSQVVESLKNKTSRIKQAAGGRLNQIQDAMSGVVISPQRAIQQIDTEVSTLQKLGKVADKETINKLQAYRTELAKNNIDLSQLSNLRSQFRQDVKGERIVMPTRSDASVNRVYRAMTSDANEAIGSNLGAETLHKYNQANAIYADEAIKLQNTRLKSVLMKGELTPEVVNNMLFSKNRSEIQHLYRSVGNDGRIQMRNGIIGKSLEKSDGSPDQFLRQLNILSNQTGIAFKGQDAVYVRGLKIYLDATKQAAKAGVTTPTGQQTIPFILGIGAAVKPATTAIAGGYGILGRMYESQSVRDAMLKLANIPKGSTAFERAAENVRRVINAIAQGGKSDALQ
ncbi:lytic transglycosylase domain-containing protein [Xenorhabdus bovienii]|uniref:lytic transglycosylase domain-containing protein n=1 Tax=Xenorhabdus bovienii TaxID=40576 RepID=UPI00237CDF2A|nr:lytic transglycosylase domain-containing protein [Xenorhabdus bovienii]MDE1492347.1 lytic transglycosylase domain-containing protein [Xenorhabdus bovienii]